MQNVYIFTAIIEKQAFLFQMTVMGLYIHLQSAILFQKSRQFVCVIVYFSGKRFPAHLNVWFDRTYEDSFCFKGGTFSVERYLGSGFDPLT